MFYNTLEDCDMACSSTTVSRGAHQEEGGSHDSSCDPKGPAGIRMI